MVSRDGRSVKLRPKLASFIITISKHLLKTLIGETNFLKRSLRTSETNYLNEAYSFYAAIRGRAYYSRAAKEDR